MSVILSMHLLNGDLYFCLLSGAFSCQPKGPLKVLKDNFIYLFLVVLGLCCHTGFPLSHVDMRAAVNVVKWLPRGGLCLDVCRIYCAVAFFATEPQAPQGTWLVAAAHGLRSCGSQALDHRLSSCVVHRLRLLFGMCGIFSQIRLNLGIPTAGGPLPLSHQANPLYFL